MILIAAVLAISLISLAAIKMTQKDGNQERSDLSNSRGKWHERHADQRWKSYNEKSRL